ncbi:antifreeze protein Maxi-like [Palaemon carinicauda]|uniref:antifreeze protein Maxi-like n=1 Tax=Palaemon carinicauda TaxID=392227 RepID=UPI0035B5B16D
MGCRVVCDSRMWQWSVAVVLLVLGLTSGASKAEDKNPVEKVLETSLSIDQIRGKRGYPVNSGLHQAILQRLQSHSGYSGTVPNGNLHLLLGGHHQSGHAGPSATDIANQAAGQATAAAASQAEAAFKAAQEAAKQVAAKASAAAQKAQAAAAEKYAQAAQLTQAAQLAQAIVFKEASQAAQNGRTVQAADAIHALALSQLATLQQALAAAEAQAAVAQQVLASAAESYYQQSAMLKQAQAAAQHILHQQNIAVSELARTQGAAQKAQSAATKALYKAHSNSVPQRTYHPEH